ncbi:CAP domain-containing protein [Actinoplanes sp. NPDC020271]|uniref:CAP domain-containing protein n=1 Tax=Actinoplanes sp. NPDC020271 TaxID=3363896 RepID=UPI00379FEA67
MSSRHRKPSRTRSLVLATAAVGVLGAGVAGIASAQTGQHRPQAAPSRTALVGGATQVAASTPTTRPHRPRPSATRTSATPAATSPGPSTPATVTPTTAAPPGPTPTGSAPAATTPAATTPAATTPASPSSPSTTTVIDAALAHINDARTANGLKALTLDAGLSTASEAHNALMAGGCGLSHQCPGEAGLGDRFTAAGVSWNSAGENIGQGNAGDTAASITQAANGLTDLMLAEVAPNDGHRKNLLNANFTRIGLAVTRGADGRVWFTQDFVN